MSRVLMAAALLFIICSSAGAQSINIQEMAFCRSIEEREPVDPDSLFSDTVGQVFCFTRITGVTDTTTIYHVWFHEDEEKARVELSVRSTPWRTWSSKLILKEWDGIWRVDILLPGGRLLRSKEFLVKPTE
jgi:hypothetical protein